MCAIKCRNGAQISAFNRREKLYNVFSTLDQPDIEFSTLIAELVFLSL